MQGLSGQRALVGHVQAVELAPGVGRGPYSRFWSRLPLLEAELVGGEVITDQLASPVTEEGTGMLAGSAGTEVIDYGAQLGERAGSIGHT